MSTTIDPISQAVLQALISQGLTQVQADSVFPPPPPPTPVPVPVPVSNMVIGFNGGYKTGAVNDTSTTVQDFLRDAGVFGGTSYVRLWTTFDPTKPAPAAGDSEYTQCLQYDNAGVKVIGVVNLQNSPGMLAPTPSQAAAFLSTLPNAKQTGIWAFELGNEVDSKTYCKDNQGNVGNWIKSMYAGLKAKGYMVIGPNPSGGFVNLYSTYLRNGVMAFMDFAGKHAYESNAQTSLADIDGVVAWLAQNAPNVKLLCSEVGLHANANTWPAQLALLWQGLKTRTGIFIFFALYVVNTPAGPGSPFNSPGVQNAPIYNALFPVLGKVAA